MTVAPARVGSNEIHLYLFDRKSGAQYDRPKELTVSATQPKRRIGPLKLRTRKTGPGHYTIPSAFAGARRGLTLEVDAPRERVRPALGQGQGAYPMTAEHRAAPRVWH